MFMPAGGDEDNVKIGGLGKKVLGDGVEVIEFPDMAHGWTVRGDLVRSFFVWAARRLSSCLIVAKSWVRLPLGT